ncbi:Uncharacterised protein [Mycobacteroides abscessus subsp. abscessus]|uniref:hypothetical protein n=1 Tax=Mycobacteroides abscessus TaxID=36809 RepID=UPI000926EDB5|nr:hypothetical protein [Mycobacteroides abscessus]MBE5451225.1 hypothetical protein [Mycobacteroides abscessus]SHW52879.1 Uncharacterised protein [Mycobacteroides abscessus subsp. abscessus]SHX58226.1 Uncharacterised protein [Mycobacteroides abscessus subsp. abscessus]SIE78762.1 Uncharacterised protein [Mycobacteroides abscessus subsp. abscessus]SII21912.1 Uncharacterised protein [Mycobacteroides abscessus subsp. abscessus]
MSSTVATAGDPAIQMHKNTAQSAREAVTELPVVSAVGIRPGHAAILEAALADTRKSLEELARVADVGASGAEALGEQDVENARKFGGLDVPKRRRKGEPPAEVR